MASIIEKRASLHKQLLHQQRATEEMVGRLTELQGLANLGTATAMIAHEINNLLTPISTYAELAINNPADSALAEKALKKALLNCRNASRVMTAILSMARNECFEKMEILLSATVEEIFNCLARDFSKDRIIVKRDIPENLTVWAVPIQIQHVLMNLILNAHEAMASSGGTLSIKAHEIPDAVRIEISDSGCGIKPQDLENIFEAFFTTKDETDCCRQHRGSGLGLAFCKQVIDAHEGSIAAQSQLDRGTAFIITLPKPDQKSA